jgi:methylated-DNA-protein-cysteine methyltransferase-like protein
MSRFEHQVLEVLRRLTPGEVATYGEVAEWAGFPGRARAVGRILAMTDEEIPWWRVVGAGGRLVSPTWAEQKALLIGEGHRIQGRTLRLG